MQEVPITGASFLYHQGSNFKAISLYETAIIYPNCRLHAMGQMGS